MMRRITGAVALAMSIGIAGCGGGGGGGDKNNQVSIGRPSAFPTEEVKVKDRQLQADIVKGRVDAIDSLFSVIYTDDQGRTKADVRKSYTDMFAKQDVIRIDLLSEKFTANPDGTRVSHCYSIDLISKELATSTQKAETRTEEQQWAREGVAWRILSLAKKASCDDKAATGGTGTGGSGGVGAAIPGVAPATSGGDGTTPAAGSTSASDSVKARDRALNALTLKGDAEGVISFYSDLYADSTGRNRADYRAVLTNYFAKKEVLRIDYLSDQFDVILEGTRVRHTGTIRTISRDKATAIQTTEDNTVVQDWAKEGDVWRILSTTDAKNLTIDNKGIGVPTQKAEDEARARDIAFNAALVRADIPSNLQYVSDYFKDEKGLTKSGLQKLMEDFYAKFSILRVDNLVFTKEQAGAGLKVFEANADGTLVKQVYVKRTIVKNLSTGEQTSFDADGFLFWANEGGTWRVISPTSIDFGVFPGDTLFNTLRTLLASTK